MIDHLLKFFVTFLVIVEPIGVIPAFIAMTEGVTEAGRRRMARKGVMIAGVIFLLFALGAARSCARSTSSRCLQHLRRPACCPDRTRDVVRASVRTRMSSLEKESRRRTISRCFARVPFIAGPGSLATILLRLPRPPINRCCLPASCCAWLWRGVHAVTLYLATPIMRLMGVTGANVVNRLFVGCSAHWRFSHIDGVRGSLSPLRRNPESAAQP